MRVRTILTATLDIIKTPNFIKFTSLSLSFLSLSFLLLYLLSPSAIFTPRPHPIPPRPSPPAYMVAQRTGIVDGNGAMTGGFRMEDVDPDALEELRNILIMTTTGPGGGEEKRQEERSTTKLKYDKYGVCEESKSEYIPCLDNVEEIERLNLAHSLQRFERHCPQPPTPSLDCLLPMPKGYHKPIPWPKSRDEVWSSNVPHTPLVDDKGGQNLISTVNGKTGSNVQMIPEIAFGYRTRTALDIDSGVASFGAFLLQRNVTTLSIAPKDVKENQIQFALERGVPAMVAVFATRRLLYPSQAFDLIHCSRCRIDWTSNDGIWLLEADRMLRAGGYFVWAAEPVYKHEQNLQQQWNEMQDLTSRICWELVKKEGDIAIWQKPLNNSCYLNRSSGVQPPLCDSSYDPDNVWYVTLTSCITRLPDNGYGGNVSSWPTRLHSPPDRLHSIKMDASLSRKDLFNAESKYWNDIIDGYIAVFHWMEKNWQNVMDMRAGFGGFAAALHDHQFDSWVMNVVPVIGFNTLPVIYDRGLIGVMHDWCEPFDTYPRTYDLLHAAGLFSAEKKRKKCNISQIMLEMDRMLRHGGTAYIRDTISIMVELEEIATAIGWVTSLHDTSEGPHASLKVLLCEKRIP
ncbi:hypothetical protein Tsubulata_035534 [Turnera subulata]|uniref:Methyltransferase n=1 Tax=Turnera subulata TaxID=218843 RepID=A0A9Q0J0C5_9ROSI|nr:hypothetical protein Tsubulata_035534 [Turnera subulata]